MGVSTDGQISYGVAIEEGFELPWADHDDIESWWREVVHGYKPPFELYTEDGSEYIGGEKPSSSRISEYYDHRRDFDKDHPIPIDVVLHCSYDYPMYIIAIKGTTKKAWRGYPVAFLPEELIISEKGEKDLKEFMEKYIPDVEFKPNWYLSSLWG